MAMNALGSRGWWSSMDLPAACTSPERLPKHSLRDYYGAADFFVHPNRRDGRDFEGFGIVFLEAAAAGLATIGGNTGGCPGGNC
jgi:phosphatidylinositol alpha-1,6-mannosyltransferase